MLSGKKKVKVGAQPTENVTQKSVVIAKPPPRREIIKHTPRVVHKDFVAFCNAVKKDYVGKLNSSWNFSFYDNKVYALAMQFRFLWWFGFLM